MRGDTGPKVTALAFIHSLTKDFKITMSRTVEREEEEGYGTSYHHYSQISR